jgi:hypothetical protein
LAVASPPRPSFLPISEPIPVPTQRCVYQQLHSNDGLPSPTKVNELLVLLKYAISFVVIKETCSKVYVKSFQPVALSLVWLLGNYNQVSTVKRKLFTALLLIV